MPKVSLFLWLTSSPRTTRYPIFKFKSLSLSLFSLSFSFSYWKSLSLNLNIKSFPSIRVLWKRFFPYGWWILFKLKFVLKHRNGTYLKIEDRRNNNNNVFVGEKFLENVVSLYHLDNFQLVDLIKEGNRRCSTWCASPCASAI